MQSENQASYYWYFDKKVGVRFNLKSWLIKTDDVSESFVAQRLNRNASELKLIKPLNSEFARIDFAEPMDFTKQRLQSETMIPSLIVGDDVDPVFMTGNIVIMPSENSDINELAATYGLKIITKLNYGAYLMAVLDSSLVLETANKIHEER